MLNAAGVDVRTGDDACIIDLLCVGLGCAWRRDVSVGSGRVEEPDRRIARVRVVANHLVCGTHSLTGRGTRESVRIVQIGQFASGQKEAVGYGSGILVR